MTGAARASAVASMASSESLSAATITEEAVAKATYLAHREAESLSYRKRQEAVDSSLATTAPAAPASAVMRTDEAAAKKLLILLEWKRSRLSTRTSKQRPVQVRPPRPRLHQLRP